MICDIAMNGSSANEVILKEIGGNLIPVWTGSLHKIANSFKILVDDWHNEASAADLKDGRYVYILYCRRKKGLKRTAFVDKWSVMLFRYSYAVSKVLPYGSFHAAVQLIPYICIW